MTDLYRDGKARREALSVAGDALLEGRARDAARILASAPRRWDASPHLAKDGSESGAIILGTSALSSERQVIMINPTQREFYTRGYNANRRGIGAWVLGFGAYGCTRLHVYADGLESALEECAAWLAKHAPGYLMAHGSDEYLALCREAFKDAGLEWTGEVDWSDPKHESAIQSAESDLTHTESGYLTSYEWGLDLENPTTEVLYAFVTGN